MSVAGKMAGTDVPQAPQLAWPEDHFGPSSSLVVVYGTGAAYLAFIIFILVCAFRQRRRQRQAEGSFDAGALRVAGDIVLHGKVAYDEGSDVAARVQVTQEGTEQESSGSWSHSWNEVGREVHVAPFYIEHESGERTRVEPPDDVLLVDEMDGKILVNRSRRIRTAELAPGEEVYAHGALVPGIDPQAAKGYRGTGRTLVLRGPHHGRMLLSSAPLGERFAKRVRFHRNWAIGIVLLLVVFQFALGGYHLRHLLGETATARITKLDYHTSKDDDGNTVHHHVVHAHVEEHRWQFSEEIDGAEFQKLTKDRPIAVRIVPGFSAQLGTQATAHFVGVILSWLALFATPWIYWYHRRSSRPWYESRLDEGGSGRLPSETEVPADAPSEPDDE